MQGGLEIPCVLIFEGDAVNLAYLPLGVAARVALLTVSFASFIAEGLMDEDKHPLGSGRASRCCKYR